MTFRFRKSIQIIPGLRMNISPRGVGYSVGGKGFRVTRGANGRVTRTVSLPGTGMSDVRTIHPATRSTGNTSRPSARAALPPAPRPVIPPHPALFAPGWEKHLFKALTDADAGRDPAGAEFSAVGRDSAAEHPDVRVLAAALDGLHQFADHAPTTQARARDLLGWVITQGVDLKTHPFVTQYLTERTWPVEIAAGIVAHLSIGHDVLLLAAAELHQAAGDLGAAIWAVEQADPTPPVALSLVELYSEADRHQDVVDLTSQVTNLDDSTALLLTLRARSFAALGHHDAARTALTEALRFRAGRSAEVRHRSLVERAELNLKINHRAAARNDLETVLAEDSQYPGVAELLAGLPPTSGR